MKIFFVCVAAYMAGATPANAAPSANVECQSSFDGTPLGWHNCRGYDGAKQLKPPVTLAGHVQGITIQCKCPEGLGYPEGWVYDITCTGDADPKPGLRPEDWANSGQLDAGWERQSACHDPATIPVVPDCVAGAQKPCENVAQHWQGVMTCTAEGFWDKCEFKNCNEGYIRRNTTEFICYKEWKPEHGYGYCM